MWLALEPSKTLARWSVTELTFEPASALIAEPMFGLTCEAPRGDTVELTSELTVSGSLQSANVNARKPVTEPTVEASIGPAREPVTELAVEPAAKQISEF